MYIGYTWIFIGIGLGTWLCGWTQATCLMISSNRQTNRLRTEFFKSILRQDVGYFDTHSGIIILPYAKIVKLSKLKNISI